MERHFEVELQAIREKLLAMGSLAESMLLYDTAFKYFRLGDASVMAVFVFGCLLLVTLGQWWLFRREVEH